MKVVLFGLLGIVIGVLGAGIVTLFFPHWPNTVSEWLAKKISVAADYVGRGFVWLDKQLYRFSELLRNIYE